LAFEKIKKVYWITSVSLSFHTFLFLHVTFNLFEPSVEHCSYKT